MVLEQLRFWPLEMKILVTRASNLDLLKWWPREGKSREHGEGKWLSARASTSLNCGQQLAPLALLTLYLTTPLNDRFSLCTEPSCSKSGWGNPMPLVPASILLGPSFYSNCCCSSQLPAGVTSPQLHSMSPAFCPNLPSSSMRCL